MQTNLLLRCMLLFPCSLWETKAGLFQFGIPVSRVTTRENDTVLKCICKIMLYDLLILCCSLFTSKLMNLENYDQGRTWLLGVPFRNLTLVGAKYSDLPVVSFLHCESIQSHHGKSICKSLAKKKENTSKKAIFREGYLKRSSNLLKTQNKKKC